MKYHLFKQSRLYLGKPYCGPSSDNVPQEFDTLEEAKRARERLSARNPVGWNIWRAGHVVLGHDFFNSH